MVWLLQFRCFCLGGGGGGGDVVAAAAAPMCIAVYLSWAVMCVFMAYVCGSVMMKMCVRLRMCAQQIKSRSHQYRCGRGEKSLRLTASAFCVCLEWVKTTQSHSIGSV